MTRILHLLVAAMVASANASAAEGERTYTIVIGPRSACVTPTSSRQARADGGVIDVGSQGPGVLAVTMTGAVAANAHLGHSSTATETFHLEQEFEITCSDSATCLVKLTFESLLIGLVRSKHKASASVKLASAKVCPLEGSGATLVLAHPANTVEAGESRLCNLNLDRVTDNRMPLGKYRLVADFVLTAEAAGIADGHSLADFSPTAALPTDWVRTRDPFQGADKKDFGFKLILTADPPDLDKSGKTAANTLKARRDAALARANANAATASASRFARPPKSPDPCVTGLDRHAGPK
jgi:hypothetical protein